MNAQEYKEFQVTITVSPSLEEIMVDWLLNLGTDHDFVSFPVDSHSSDHEGLSLAEQVAGRRKRLRFQIAIGSEELGPFLDRLKQDFQGSGIHYRVVPFVESGHL
jgi:Protein of unknown function (DUF3240)